MLDVYGRVWAVSEEVRTFAERLLNAQLNGAVDFAARRAILELHAWDDDQRREQAAAGGVRKGAANVAIIPVVGLTTHRGRVIDSALTQSTAKLSDTVRQAAADESVHATVLEFDTPGGEVNGGTEWAATIREARAVKPVVAIANTVAGSLGYMAFSQGTESFVTPSGSVGSIGVYGAHLDQSAELAAKGQKVTIVSAGKFKTERNPTGPLSEEALAAWQADVDHYYSMFVADVAKGRGVSVDVVRREFGEGRMVKAKDAVAKGMADHVGTLDDAIKRAGALAVERQRAGASVAHAQGEMYRRQRGM